MRTRRRPTALPAIATYTQSAGVRTSARAPSTRMPLVTSDWQPSTRMRDATIHGLAYVRVRPAGTLTEVSTHHDPARNEQVAVRPALARTGIWAVLGELHDVTRFVAQPPDRALLLPSALDADRAGLLHHAGTADIGRYTATASPAPSRRTAPSTTSRRTPGTANPHTNQLHPRAVPAGTGPDPLPVRCLTAHSQGLAAGCGASWDLGDGERAGPAILAVRHIPST